LAAVDLSLRVPANPCSTCPASTSSGPPSCSILRAALMRSPRRPESQRVARSAARPSTRPGSWPQGWRGRAVDRHAAARFDRGLGQPAARIRARCHGQHRSASRPARPVRTRPARPGSTPATATAARSSRSGPPGRFNNLRQPATCTAKPSRRNTASLGSSRRNASSDPSTRAQDKS
jgi:hypothetical protein